LRKEKDLGTIATGKLADVVVLAADPLSDITNTRRIERVFLGGEQMDISFHPDYKISIPRPVVDSQIGSSGLSVNNVIPNIATEGSEDLTVELVGHFFPSAKVTFNKIPVQSTFVSVGRLKVVIPSTLLENVGSYVVQVEDSFEDQTFRSNPIFFVVKYK